MIIKPLLNPVASIIVSVAHIIKGRISWHIDGRRGYDVEGLPPLLKQAHIPNHQTNNAYKNEDNNGD